MLGSGEREGTRVSKRRVSLWLTLCKKRSQCADGLGLLNGIVDQGSPFTQVRIERPRFEQPFYHELLLGIVHPHVHRVIDIP